VTSGEWPGLGWTGASVCTTSEPTAGLWLWSAFVSHSCLPNVHHVTIGSWFILRAARDINAGTALYDSYTDVFRPVGLRNDKLKPYGFRCQCDRCDEEKQLLRPDFLRRLVQRLGAAPGLEEQCAAIEFTIDHISQLTGSNANLAMRLLGAFAPLLLACASLMEDSGCCEEALDVYHRLEDVIAVVKPNSDMHAACTNAICRCLWRLNRWRSNAGHEALMQTLVVHQNTYGGGSLIWQTVSDQTGELPPRACAVLLADCRELTCD